MFPNLWIFDMYSVFMFIGILACFALLYLYMKKNNLKRNYILDSLILACISIALGILSAALFQFIFDSLKENSTNPIFSMTFFGGLIGGVITFIIGYFLYMKKRYPDNSFIKDIVIIAPACITIAHAFGRIGCFMAGCCHGIETDSILGVRFPGLEHNVYPTQLFEAIFLFLLSSILFYLAYKHKFKYTFTIYLISYGIFRFLIEFIRGDDRGAFLGILSPSQVISIICILIGIGIMIYFILASKKSNKENDSI